jgi:hypothetical protein
MPARAYSEVSARPVLAGLEHLQYHHYRDILLLGDGTTRAEVTDIRHGLYRFQAGLEPGIAIGWRFESSSGLLFRKASDLVQP